MSRMRLGRRGILWTSGDMWNSPVRRRPASVWCWTAWPPTTSAPRTLTSSISSTTSSRRKSCQRKRPSSSSMTLSASWRVYTRCVVMGFSDLGVLEWCFIFTIVEKQLSLDCMSYELSNFVPANIMLFYWWFTLLKYKKKYDDNFCFNCKSVILDKFITNVPECNSSLLYYWFYT